MGSYKRGPWDKQLDSLMDVNVCCGVTHGELEAADLLDHEKDRHQETGYRYLRAIHREPDSPSVERWAEAALNCFAEAERLENLTGKHVHNGEPKSACPKDQAVDSIPAAGEQHCPEADPPGEERLTWTIPQAAKRLNIGENTARRKFNTGEIPGLIVMNRRKVVSRQTLTEWIAEQGSSQ